MGGMRCSCSEDADYHKGSSVSLVLGTDVTCNMYEVFPFSFTTDSIKDYSQQQPSSGMIAIELHLQLLDQPRTRIIEFMSILRNIVRYIHSEAICTPC